ncbi:ABC transporter ATP-binding protein [Pontibacillus salicampi]|uniref:ABC transporter ATP-binding protein n=1 Tax=Pontibacillus salicampi TaxID=1449801 RepID=A0ABV6LK45_9BACI
MLTINQLGKIYGGRIPYKALENIEMKIDQGEFVGIMGPSGSGKTTLLNLISTIDRPSSGEVLIEGKNPYTLKQKELAKFRRQELGFVFQDFNLLDTLTVEENIVLPLTLEGKPLKEMEEKVNDVAQKLGIESILRKRTYEISGGQSQRASIARAIIHNPKLLLADEPTGNLDSKSSKAVMETMEYINQSEKTTMMLVTHDPLAASYCNRVIFIKDGALYNEIHQTSNRQDFFQNIIDVLSMLGGNAHDLSSVRIP